MACAATLAGSSVLAGIPRAGHTNNRPPTVRRASERTLPRVPTWPVTGNGLPGALRGQNTGDCRAMRSPEVPLKEDSRYVSPTWQSPIEGLSPGQVTEAVPSSGSPDEASEQQAHSGQTATNGSVTNGSLSRGDQTSASSSCATVTLPGDNPPELNQLPAPTEEEKQNGSATRSLGSLLTKKGVGDSAEQDSEAAKAMGVYAADSSQDGGREALPKASINQPTVTYVLRLGTSKIAGSGMTDRNSGVQVAVIGQSGQAISARVYPTVKEASGKLLTSSAAGPEETQPESKVQDVQGERERSSDEQQPNVVFSATGEEAFREGGQAVVCLQAPDVQPIAALWLAPLSDRWRLSDAAVGVLGRGGGLLKQDRKQVEESAGDGDAGSDNSTELCSSRLADSIGTLYVFKPDEYEALGTSADALAVELRPIAVRAIKEDSLVRLLEGSSYLSGADASLEVLETQLQAEALLRQAAKQEGLEEYRKLKEWLLLSTSILVVVGSFVATQIGGESMGAAFAAGGLMSILFLVKLQRDVDSIQPPPAVSLKTDERRAAAALEALGSEMPTLDSTDKEKAAQLPESLREKAAFKINLGPVTIDGPILLRLVTVGLCFCAVLLLVSKGQGSSGGGINPQSLPKIEPGQMVAGLMGFLTHKVSIILAAFRRTPRS